MMGQLEWNVQYAVADKLQHALKPKFLLVLCTLMAIGLVFNGKMTSHLQRNIYGWMQLVPEDTPKCNPRTNIVFLKTHKCASSTVQNVIMRFGDVHNLTFVLPEKGNYLGHPKPFMRTMVPSTKRFNLTYNILTHHSRLNYPEMHALMPSDSVFVTIVRDPVDLYESLYSYYNLQSLFKQPLVSLLKNLTPRTLAVLNKRMSLKIGRNQMSFDMGLDRRYFDNSTAVLSFIKSIDSIFDLVMIAERMEESLVLLKNLMCWDVDDVVVFRHNARSDKFKSQLDKTERTKLRIINLADQMLYDYFVKRLDERIKQFGEAEMAAEVAVLRNRTQSWYNFCVSKQDMMSKLMPKGYRAHKKVMGFQQANGTNETCAKLIQQELPYTDYLRKRQLFLFPPPPPIRMSMNRLGYKMLQDRQLGKSAASSGRSRSSTSRPNRVVSRMIPAPSPKSKPNVVVDIPKTGINKKNGNSSSSDVITSGVPSRVGNNSSSENEAAILENHCENDSRSNCGPRNKTKNQVALRVR